MEILNKKQKIILYVVIAVMLAFIGYYIISKSNDDKYVAIEIEDNDLIQESNIIEEKNKIEEKIIVHMTGAIKKEGVIKIDKGSRVSDAIEAAGGISKDADLSKINLAYLIQDGQKIYVPSINDKNNENYITEGAGINVIENDKKNNGKVNINTASQTELETLSGIGTSTALKIINYRNENGKFKKIEDLTNVPGIGQSKFDSIKDNICTE